MDYPHCVRCHRGYGLSIKCREGCHGEAMENEERKSWEQMEGESSLLYGRFTVYLRLGTKRSIATVYKKEKKGEKGSNIPHGSWYDVEKEWKWKERAKDYDEWQRAEEDRIIAEEREKVLRSGFALQHKRIKELDRLARKLIRYTNDEEKIWIPETKTTTFGEEKSQIVEKIVFNAPLFTVIEKYQASIAAEMGERVKKQELTGKDGGSMEFEIELVGNKPEEDDESEG